eukprot:TRINITY_DN15554_c0_g2_i1.p1 TRINITY_DN15554_c0_g2~~TRINITY_DN15554_c0_g2_i1.p1  ORF type:complete len:701 (+),score=103.76 TRINITY_DN15554_c0_g2_i1:177-2279(+)
MLGDALKALEKCEPCWDAQWSHAGQPAPGWRGEEFLDKMSCVSSAGGRFCVGAPSLRWECRTWAYCAWSVGDHPSLTGLFGMFQLSGNFVSVTIALLFLLSLIIYVGWLAFVFKTLLNALKWCRENSGPWNLFDSLASMRSFFQQFLVPDPLKDLPPELREQAGSLLKKRRVQRCRTAATLLFALLPVVSAYGFTREVLNVLNVALTTCTEHDNGCWPKDIFKQQMAGSHVVVSAFLLLACMVPALQPHRANWKTPLTMHISIYLGIAWHLLEMTEEEEWRTWQQTMFVYIRLVAAIVDGDACVAAALNVSLLIMQLCFLATKQFEYLSLHEIQASIAHVFIICLLTTTLQYTRRDLVKQLLLAASKSEENVKLKGMLNLMCDAVVELRDQCIQSACPQLAALTLRGSQFGLQGKRLIDLICEDDRDRCAAALQDVSSQCALLHVRILDGLGSSVAVQLFIATLRACSSVSQHIVGIRDDSEPGMMPVSSLQDANGLASFLLPNAWASRSAQGELSAFDSDAEPSRESAPSVLSSLPEGMSVGSLASDALVTLAECPAGWPEIPVVWLRTDSSWAILRVTRAFVQVVGPSSLQASMPSDLRTWMPPDKQRGWERWAKWLQKKPAARAGAGYPQLRLMPPGMAGTTIGCNLIFLCSDIAEESNDEAQVTSMAFMLANVFYRSTREKDKEDGLEDESSRLRL